MKWFKKLSKFIKDKFSKPSPIHQLGSLCLREQQDRDKLYEELTTCSYCGKFVLPGPRGCYDCCIRLDLIYAYGGWLAQKWVKEVLIKLKDNRDF